MVQWSILDNAHIVALMALPFALLKSHVFWLVSALWTLCTAQLSPEEISNVSSDVNHIHHSPRSSQHPGHRHHSPTALPSSHPPSSAITHSSQSVRKRGLSEPPIVTAQLLAGELRPRSATASHPRQCLRLFHGGPDQDLILRPSCYDERIGITCPPQWWQKTRLYLDPRKQASSLPARKAAIEDKRADAAHAEPVDQQRSQEEQKSHHDRTGRRPFKKHHARLERIHNRFRQRYPEAKFRRRASIPHLLHVREDQENGLPDVASNEPRRSLSIFRRKKP